MSSTQIERFWSDIPYRGGLLSQLRNVGNVAKTKDTRGNITHHEYFDSRLLKETIAPALFYYYTIYEYYADGKLKHVRRSMSRTTILVTMPA